MNNDTLVFDSIIDQLNSIALTLNFNIIKLRGMKHAVLKEHEKVKMLDPKNFPVVFAAIEGSLQLIDKSILSLEQIVGEINNCEKGKV